MRNTFSIVWLLISWSVYSVWDHLTLLILTWLWRDHFVAKETSVSVRRGFFSFFYYRPLCRWPSANKDPLYKASDVHENRRSFLSENLCWERMLIVCTWRWPAAIEEHLHHPDNTDTNMKRIIKKEMQRFLLSNRNVSLSVTSKHSNYKLKYFVFQSTILFR